MVHLCAKRFHLTAPLEYDDLFQAGCVGLCKAAANFEPQRGLRFSTYAVPVILGEMRAIFRTGGAVHVSRSLQQLSQQIKTTQELLSEKLGRPPAVTELSAEVGKSVERTAEALGVLSPPLSLSVGEDGEELNIPVSAPEEKLCEHMTLQTLLRELPPADQALIRCRYFQHKTQTQTAALLSMTQVQVSRREKKILAELRGKMG